jgi:hypothetical protein
MKIERNLELQIILVKPPLHVPYALQHGSGSNFNVEQKQVSKGSDLLFVCTVVLKEDKEGRPDFRGPYVQGSAGERFVYIGIGKFAGIADSPWERRLKVPLRGITQSLLKTKKGAVPIIKTFVEGTDKLGGPTCATPKPFAGWVRLSSD